jgi:citrate lyase subunit beta / citryl-CoA lyase
MDRGDTLRTLRSLLFIPAIAPHLLPKATSRGADALIVDLEDSVPVARKLEARAMAAQAVTELAARNATVLVRVNVAPADYLLDLAALPLERVAAVMLPKVESTDDIERFAAALARHGAPDVPIAALLESPRAVLGAASIAAHPRLVALGFGVEDYAAAIGVPPTPVALMWPAQQVIAAAHAYGLGCWGLAASIADVADLDAFGAAARTARAIGFTGSVCIHPAQVPVLNAGFSPSAAELDWAARVVAADAQARAAGQGAVLLDGRMIDLPIVERARRWLAGAGTRT